MGKVYYGVTGSYLSFSYRMYPTKENNNQSEVGSNIYTILVTILRNKGFNSFKKTNTITINFLHKSSI